MKATIFLCFLFLFCRFFCYSQKPDKIISCAVTIKSVNGLKMSQPVKLVNVKEEITGEADVNGYQFVYASRNQKPFVQVKTENISGKPKTIDTASAFAYLQTLNSTADSSLIRLSYNGFRMYGVVRNPETANGIIESFLMLPDNNEILQFDFFASGSDDAGFQNDSYLAARNSFFGDYTNQLRKCLPH